MTTAVPTTSPDTMPYSGDVVCERVAGRSVLTRLRSTDPLKLLAPRTSGDAAQVVLSSYGGGLLGGDRVDVRLAVRAGAALAVTTQSAGKVYRTEQRAAEQSVDAAVEAGAVLAVLPDPLCAFTDARFRQRQRFELAADASLVWLDWLTSGRHGRGERWAMRQIESRTTVNVNGRAVLRETLTLDDRAQAIGAAFRGGRFNAYAVLVVVGPRVNALAEHGRQAIAGLPLNGSATLLAADSTLPGGRVFRVLGPDAQTVRRLLADLLSLLSGILGHDPWGRKW